MTSPAKAHALVYDAFKLAAFAGDIEVARRLLALMYGTLPPAKKVLTALSTHAIDVFAHAAGFGDVTGGKPSFAYGFADGGPLPERVAAIERGVRMRVCGNAFAGDYPKNDAWKKKKRDDPFYAIDRFRRVQLLVHPEHATPETERDALERVREILADWPASENGPGMGAELAIGLDLAFRLGQDDDATRAWLAEHGHRFRDDDLIETCLCFPAIARRMADGFFRAYAGEAKVLAARFAKALAVATAVAPEAAPARRKAPPKIQKRKVSAEYAQVQLEPPSRTDAEREQVVFQDARESAQGMSLFPSVVGIATPSETESVDVELVIEVGVAASDADLAGAVQAVAFPLIVRDDGVVVRGVSDPDDVEPLFVPSGRYDVLAVFRAPKKAARSAKTGLRRFALRLSFRAAGSLGAPRCFVLEHRAST